MSQRMMPFGAPSAGNIAPERNHSRDSGSRFMIDVKALRGTHAPSNAEAEAGQRGKLAIEELNPPRAAARMK